MLQKYSWGSYEYKFEVRVGSFNIGILNLKFVHLTYSYSCTHVPTGGA